MDASVINNTVILCRVWGYFSEKPGEWQNCERHVIKVLRKIGFSSPHSQDRTEGRGREKTLFTVQIGTCYKHASPLPIYTID